MIKKRIAIGLVIVAVLAAGVTAAAMYVNNKMDKVQKVEIKDEDIEVNDEVEDLEGYTNIALFGVDSRDGNLGTGNRTDTIMIASINNDTNEIKLVSVFRDTYLNLAGEKDIYNKANSAYSQGGPKQAINMLNKNLDLSITDYVAVDFNAVVKVVDLLGGIEVELTEEERVHLNNYAIETSKVTGVKTEEVTETGLVKLDGVQTTSYMRIRYTAGDDYKRTERQRLVLEKLFEKVKTIDMKTLNKMLDEVLPMVSTSLSGAEILTLGKNALSYELSDQVGFPFELETKTIGKKGSCVIPKDLESNVKELHKVLFDKEDYTPSSKVKEISNKIISDAGSGSSSDDDDNNTSNTTNKSNKSNSNSNNSSNTKKKGTSDSSSTNKSGSNNNSNNNSSNDEEDMMTITPEENVEGGSTPPSGGGSTPPSGGGSTPPSGGGTPTNPGDSSGNTTNPGTGNNTGSPNPTGSNPS